MFYANAALQGATAVLQHLAAYGSIDEDGGRLASIRGGLPTSGSRETVEQNTRSVACGRSISPEAHCE